MKLGHRRQEYEPTYQHGTRQRMRSFRQLPERPVEKIKFEIILKFRDDGAKVKASERNEQKATKKEIALKITYRMGLVKGLLIIPLVSEASL